METKIIEKKNFEKILMNYTESDEQKKYIVDYFINHYPDENKEWNLCSIVFIKNPKLVKLICSNEQCMNILKKNIKDLNEYYKELAYYIYGNEQSKIFNMKGNNISKSDEENIIKFFKTYYSDKRSNLSLFVNREFIRIILNDKSCLEILQPDDCYDYVVKYFSCDEVYKFLDVIVDEIVKNKDLLNKCPNIGVPLIEKNFYDVLRKLLDNKIINLEYLFEHVKWFDFVGSLCCSNLLKDSDFNDKENNIILNEIINNKEFKRSNNRIKIDTYINNIYLMINKIEFPKEVKPKYLIIIICNRISKINKLMMLHNILSKSEVIFTSKRDKKRFNKFVYLFDKTINNINNQNNNYSNIILETVNKVICILEKLT